MCDMLQGYPMLNAHSSLLSINPMAMAGRGGQEEDRYVRTFMFLFYLNNCKNWSKFYSVKFFVLK